MHNSVDPDLPVLRNPDHEWLHTTGVRFNSESHWQSQWHTITDRPDLFRQCHPAGYPKSDPQTPENMAATIYEALGLPRTLVWKDKLDRPHQVYHGDPIPGLT